MAVVNIKSDLFNAPSGTTSPDPQKARGLLRSSHFTVANGATDSSL